MHNEALKLQKLKKKKKPFYFAQDVMSQKLEEALLGGSSNYTAIAKAVEAGG